MYWYYIYVYIYIQTYLVYTYLDIMLCICTCMYIYVLCIFRTNRHIKRACVFRALATSETCTWSSRWNCLQSTSTNASVTGAGTAATKTWWKAAWEPTFSIHELHPVSTSQHGPIGTHGGSIYLALPSSNNSKSKHITAIIKIDMSFVHEQAPRWQWSISRRHAAERVAHRGFTNLFRDALWVKTIIFDPQSTISYKSTVIPHGYTWVFPANTDVCICVYMYAYVHIYIYTCI